MPYSRSHDYGFDEKLRVSKRCIEMCMCINLEWVRFVLDEWNVWSRTEETLIPVTRFVAMIKHSLTIGDHSACAICQMSNITPVRIDTITLDGIPRGDGCIETG